MYRKIFTTVLFLSICFVSFSQVPSPESFLGYALGSKYTPHWRVLEYYRAVAAAAPTKVKIQEYGKTNEGRTLMVACVSTSGNISKLETIRNNNLGLAGIDGTGTVNNSPVIVWLSYNVHGNETSSSEAGMATLYALASGTNTQANKWLENTLVIMDPCVNPDGRDRYVNWFNSVVGSSYNPSLDAREHREPWPGGRTNHYNFDLNRDWAWQTQTESQQRMKLYNQWLPEIHVDFHEQGINSPYYFAPAAQPYHEVITQWQRDFQYTIGRNHAKYFDQKGWLYFTREVFDLLYPSYGDTYPIYNGAIGMTYEQGGGPAGGLGVKTQSGDTLTLLDRINHHFTTSLSTVETASNNAEKLLTEFQKFFRNASVNGVGEFKSFVIKYSDRDAQRISALKKLLSKNGINFGEGNQANLRGFNYENGKEENFSLSEKDLVVPTTQPKGTLVKVLFEPNTQVVDSNTYDITAWSLPYAYGLKAYGTKQSISVPSISTEAAVRNIESGDPYAYIIPWNGTKTVKLVTQLMSKGIKMRMNQLPFSSGGKDFERGSVIVLKTNNQYEPNLWPMVRSVANDAGVLLTPVTTGFVEKGYDFGSSKTLFLQKRRVAIITGEGINSNAAGEAWFYFEKELEYPVTLINQSDMGRIRWSDYDVVVMPDGNYKFFSDKTQTDAFKNWIQGGGHVVALEGAVSQLVKLDIGLKSKKSDDAESKDAYANLRRFESRERDFIPTITPGSIYRVELDNTHPLAFGYPNYYYTLKQDDNIYDFLKDGWNVGIIRKDKQVAGFVGSKLRDRLQDGLLFGVQDVGGGTITYLTDNLLFRNFWENGKLMFANAVFLVGQ